MALRLTRLDLMLRHSRDHVFQTHLLYKATQEWCNIKSLWLAPMEFSLLDHTALLRPLASTLKTLDLTYHHDSLRFIDAMEALQIWCGPSSVPTTACCICTFGSPETISRKFEQTIGSHSFQICKFSESPSLRADETIALRVQERMLLK